MNINFEKDLVGKSILVTGASKGLGAMTCYSLAQKGAKLAMLSRSIKEMNNLKKKLKNPSKHISIRADFNKNIEIKQAVAKAKKFLKKIDIVIHIAGGGFGFKDPLIENKELNTLLQINLYAAAEINNSVVKNKLKNHTLKLIHVGSIASSEAVGSVGYNVAKAALSSYVRSLGRELYKQNVIVTGILPGGFIAKNNAMDRFKKKNLLEYKKFIKDRLPRKVMGNAKEVIPMLLFLCSKHSSMMGGCMVPIDAGEGKSYLF